MPNAASGLLTWSPRILGIVVALFFGAFALDAIGEGPVGLLVHLAPVILMLGVVAVSWHRPWLGGIAFVALAVLYAVATPDRLDWILPIAGPLLAVGILFLCSWWVSRPRHAIQ